MMSLLFQARDGGEENRRGRLLTPEVNRELWDRFGTNVLNLIMFVSGVESESVILECCLEQENKREVSN